MEVIDMFRVKNISADGIRVGILRYNEKVKETPVYFMTNDFGGGGTNIPRVYSYLEYFEDTNPPILLNYYYLNPNLGKPKFNVDWLRRIPNYEDIVFAFHEIRKDFHKRGWTIHRHKLDDTKWNPITMLDSGSGMILKYLIKIGKIQSFNDISIYENIVKNYIEFGTKLNFNICIAMDFAKKYTYKNGETKNQQYRIISKSFSSDLEKNLYLLKMTLESLKNISARTSFYAPIHGETPAQYSEYVERILEIENEIGVKFDGFAIGSPLSESNHLWQVPENVPNIIKKTAIFGKATVSVRNILENRGDKRPIHVLAAGNIFSVIPLVISGADFFDCHSIWRRASDGNLKSAKYVFDYHKGLEVIRRKGEEYSFSRILIPLLDKEGNIITENKKPWKFIILPKVTSDSFRCDCPICEKYELDELKKLYKEGKEENYFVKILIYRHAIYQYEYLCKKLIDVVNNNEDINKFIGEFPPRLRKDLMTTIKIIRDN